MQKSYLSLFSIFIVLLTSHLFSVAYAAEVNFIINQDGLWQRQIDGKDMGNPIPSGPMEQEDGLDIYGAYAFFNGISQNGDMKILWLAVTSDNNKENEGECGPEGVYFYDKSTGKYSFLPIEEGRFLLQNISFTSGLDKFIINHDSLYQVFTFPDFTAKSSGRSVSRAVWLDSSRILYAKAETGFDRGEDKSFATSVVIQDTDTGKTEILKKATAMSDFMPGIWEPGMITGQENDVLDGVNINVTEIYVTDLKDWTGYVDKAKVKLLSIPIPQ